MPVYHFEVRRINETFSDADGLVFDNFGDAWEEATVAACQMVKDLDGELVAGMVLNAKLQIRLDTI